MKSDKVNLNFTELDNQLTGNKYKKNILAFLKLIEKYQEKWVSFDRLYTEYLELVPFSNAKTRLRRLLTRTAETGVNKGTEQSKLLNIPLTVGGIKTITQSELIFKKNGDVDPKTSDNNIYTFIIEE